MWCIVTISCNLIITRFVLHCWSLNNGPLLGQLCGTIDMEWLYGMLMGLMWLFILVPIKWFTYVFTVNSKHKWPSFINAMDVYVFNPLAMIKYRIICLRKKGKRCSWYSVLVSFYQRGRQWHHWLPCKLLKIKLRCFTSSDTKWI